MGARAAGALGIVALVALARPGAAQRAFAGVAGMTFAEHRVDAGFGVERTAGPIVAAGAALQAAPRLVLALEARAGTLPSQSGGALDRDFGELGFDVRLRALRWLMLDGGATWRSYSSAVGRQRWLLLRTGTEARVPLAWGNATAIFRLGYLPVVAVPRLRNPRLAFEAGAGVEYQAGPARLRALFSLERYDFAAAGSLGRMEQLSGISVVLILPLGRAD